MYSIWLKIRNREKKVLSWSLRELLTVLLKRMEDLFQFGVCPETRQKFCRMFFMVATSVGSALPQIIRSSANINEWIGGPLGPNRIPETESLSIASWRQMDSSLIAVTKRYGDKGQPCRIPLWALKAPKGWPLTSTEKGCRGHASADKIDEMIMKPLTSKSLSNKGPF